MQEAQGALISAANNMRPQEGQDAPTGATRIPEKRRWKPTFPHVEAEIINAPLDEDEGKLFLLCTGQTPVGRVKDARKDMRLMYSHDIPHHPQTSHTRTRHALVPAHTNPAVPRLLRPAAAGTVKAYHAVEWCIQ